MFRVLFALLFTTVAGAESTYSILFEEDPDHEILLAIPRGWIETEDWHFQNNDSSCHLQLKYLPLSTLQDLENLGNHLLETYHDKQIFSYQSDLSPLIYWQTFTLANRTQVMIGVYPLENYLISMAIEAEISPADDFTAFMRRIVLRSLEPSLPAEDPESAE